MTKSKSGSQPAGRDTGPNRRRNGDIHVASMAGDVRKVPGSGTTNGDKALADMFRDTLERVRRGLRERPKRSGA